MTRSYIVLAEPSAITANRPAPQLAPWNQQRYECGTMTRGGPSMTWATHSSCSDHTMNQWSERRCGNCITDGGMRHRNGCTLYLQQQALHQQPW
eukprot:12893974-Prorocentrum_lima.AAC.1